MCSLNQLLELIGHVMIDYRVSDQQAESLEGRIIFHSGKGADVSSVLMPQSTVKIGVRLGKVTRITGPFRIFYVAPDDSEKYVSAGGIGYVCDTEEEARALESLRDETTERIRSSVAAAHADLQSRVEALVAASKRST